MPTLSELNEFCFLFLLGLVGMMLYKTWYGIKITW